MNITRVRAKEIFDSRGYPTIACSISLENGTTVEASVPSGASCGDFEAFELYDKDGTGVQKAVQVIESIIAPIEYNHFAVFNLLFSHAYLNGLSLL